MKKAKTNKWNQLKGKGDIGLHLPLGKTYEGGFLSSTSYNNFFNIVGFVNIETGEIKIFLKSQVEKIGINNLKLD